ncbi:MAG TPA: RodZ domain-containing protein [bacterium]|nr:RodZ domain-containing protein [bacterium]
MNGREEPIGIGERLRNAREARGWSLADASELTRIRAVFLQAIEDEQFDQLPGKTYVRGFLRTYASSLGLDPEELFDAYHMRFDAPIQPIVGAHAVEVPIRPTARHSRLRRIAPLFVAVLLLILMLFAFDFARRMQALNTPASQPTTVQPVAPPPPLARPGPEPAQGPPAAPVETPERAPLILVVRASQETWIRVVADGGRVYQGLVAAGETRSWNAQRTMTVRVGNSTGVALELNGESVEAPSQRRVWEQTFTAP